MTYIVSSGALNSTHSLTHHHVKAVFGRKKTVQSKSVPEMAVFRKFWVQIKNIVIGTPKRHFLTRNDVI